MVRIAKHIDLVPDPGAQFKTKSITTSPVYLIEINDNIYSILLD